MADFVQHAQAFGEANVDVICASADSLEEAQRMQKEQSVPFPVAFGLDPAEVSASLGAYYEDEEEPYLHATSFVVVDGRVRLAVYSTGAHGRLTAEEALKDAVPEDT